MTLSVKNVGQPQANQSAKLFNGDAGQKEIDKITQEATQPVLQQPPAQAEGWRVWNWFGWSGNPTEETLSPVVSRQEEGTQQTMGEAEEGPKEEQAPIVQEAHSEPQPVVNPQPIPDVAELKIPEGNGNIAPAAAASPVVDQKARFDQAAVKTEQAGQGWLGYLQQTRLGAKVQQYATAGAQALLNNYANTINKSALLAQAKETMGDPQFIELFQTIYAALAQQVTGKIQGLEEGFVAQNIRSQKELIQDLVEINVARGFANLARQMQEQSQAIPNYNQQPLLVSLLSFLSQKIGPNLNLQQFADIEAKYRASRVAVGPLLQAHFSPEELAGKQELVQQYIQTNDLGKKTILFDQLFPGYDDKQGEELARINTLNSHLMELNKKHQELKTIFDQIADNVLLCLFPNKLADLEIPGVLQYSFVQNRIYSWIHDSIADLLHTSYESLENDVPRVQKWENALKERSGVNDLQPILQAPTAFLVGYTKDFIQSNPKAIELTTQGLSAIRNSPEGQDPHAALMVQLSQGPLAGWIVESIQTLLHTQDPHLLSAGHFVKDIFSRLTLALMSKGAVLAIPEGEQIDADHFVKELADRLIKKIKDLQNENIPQQFWEDFVQDLPLPALLKDLLIPILKEKAQALQEPLKAINPALEEIQKVYQEAGNQLQAYKGGEELLSIVEKISDQVMELVLDDKMGLISTLGLEETIEELFDQYLPGVRLNEDLKKWFSNNINALKTQQGQQNPESIALIEKGIQAVLRKALVTTIETNFKNDGDDYAAQLLKNIREAFAKAFVNFGEEERAKINAALAIQTEIQAIKGEIETLKEINHTKPQGITEAQQALFQEVVVAHTRRLRASHHHASLETSLKAKLDKLNESFEGTPWTIEQLPVVHQALTLHKTLMAAYRTKEECTRQIAIEIQRMIPLALIDAAHRQKLNQYRTLLALLNIPTEELKLVTDALHIEATLKQAQKEIELLNQELLNKKAAVNHENGKSLENRQQWDQGRIWLGKVLNNRQAIKQKEDQIKTLQKQLDANLTIFQTLANEFSALIGLDQKEKLHLPDFLRDTVWPYIEAAKNEQLARLLFEHITPLLLPAFDSDENRKTLQTLSGNKTFWAQVAQLAAKETIQHIPDFVTSYKPFVNQILQVMGIANPSNDEINKMEISLQQTMIQLGKVDIQPALLQPIVKGLIATEQQEVFLKSLTQCIAQAQTNAYTQEHILPLLRPLSPQPLTQEEEQKLAQLAKLIAKNLNQFLFNRGKSALNTEKILDAYRQQLHLDQADIQPENKEEALKALKDAQIVEKIQMVVLTPEEVAQTLNDVIPGAKDLHTLVAPQLQAALVGEDVRFQENRDLLKDYVEGMILRLLVKVAGANTEDRQGIFVVITRKLKELPPSSNALRNRSAEEVAHDLIDQVLTEILGIKTQEDLEGIPLPLKKLVYDKIKDIAYEQLSPLVLPIIEREQDRKALKTLSGSDFLGSLSITLSLDIFDLLPLASKSYQAIASELWTVLAEQAPTADQLNQFTLEIEELVKAAKEKNITNKALVKAYVKVAQVNLTIEQKIDLRAKLAERQAKEEIRNVLMTPEKIVELVSESIPGLSAELKLAFIAELQDFIHHNPESYKNLSAFVSSYVEDILLKFFAGIAKKNPPQGDKDTLVIVTEKLLALATSKYQAAKGRSPEEVARELNDELMRDILGIDSPQALAGLPEALQKVIYDAIQDQLGEFLIRLHQSLQTLDPQDARVQEAKEKAKRFGIQENAEQAYFTILTNDLAQMVVDSVPQVLAKKVDGKAIKGVTSISKSVQTYLEELARGNMRVAKTLLNYSQAPKFQEILGEQLTGLHESPALVEDKKKATDMISNLLLVPLNRALQTAIDFEEKKGEDFTRHLMAKILHVGAGHLANLNAAKKAAALEERTHILHKDFVGTLGESLHPAVPTSPITYQGIVNEINRRLGNIFDADQQAELRQAIEKLAQQEMQGAKLITLNDIVAAVEAVQVKAKQKLLTERQRKDLVKPDAQKLTLKDFIRQEMETHVEQRQKYAYGPAIKEVVKLLFPNGKKDLVEVPEELRSQVWKMYKQNLFPLLLPMLTELVLDPDMITTMVLSSLEATRDNLSGEIVLGTPEPADRPLDELDEVSGELMAEVMKMVKLPAWAKKIVIDPQGNVYPSMKKTIGATLRSQFTSNFILDKLKVGLASAVRRDENGEYSIKYDKRAPDLKTAEADVKRQEKEKKLIAISREVVDVSISYFIRNKWVTAQASFDAIVRKVFGKVGAALKSALDWVFRVIFFKIIGTLLSLLVSPIKGWVKNKIYDMISLDENRDQILEMFRRVPEDQPTADTYAIYNEDLVYKMCGALKEAVVDFIDQPLPEVTPGEVEEVEPETPGEPE